MKDLLEFSKTNNDNNNIVPLSQISESIYQKADEKRNKKKTKR
jgi:hypothetical protein